MKKLGMQRSARVLGAIGLAVASLAVAGCGGSDSSSERAATTAPAEAATMEETMQENIVETAVAAGDFTTLTSLVEKAGLAESSRARAPSRSSHPQTTPSRTCRRRRSTRWRRTPRR